MSGAHTVGNDMEQAGSAGFVNRIYKQHTVSFHHLFIQCLEVIFLGADHAFSHHQTSGTCHTAAAVLDIPVKQVDKFDLCPCFLRSLQRNPTHGVIVSVSGSQ